MDHGRDHDHDRAHDRAGAHDHDHDLSDKKNSVSVFGGFCSGGSL